MFENTYVDDCFALVGAHHHDIIKLMIVMDIYQLEKYQTSHTHDLQVADHLLCTGHTSLIGNCVGITLLTNKKENRNRAQKHFLKCNVGIMCLQKGRNVGM